MHTLEHICPQSTLDDPKNRLRSADKLWNSWSSWRSMSSDMLSRLMHSLGNLLLLPKRANSAAAVKGYADKLLIYRDDRHEIVLPETVARLPQRWDPDDALTRLKESARLLVQFFRRIDTTISADESVSVEDLIDEEFRRAPTGRKKRAAQPQQVRADGDETGKRKSLRAA